MFILVDEITTSYKPDEIRQTSAGSPTFKVLIVRLSHTCTVLKQEVSALVFFCFIAHTK